MKRKSTFLILVLLTVSLMLVSCEQGAQVNNPSDVDDGIIASSSGESAPPVNIKLFSEKNKIQVGEELCITAIYTAEYNNGFADGLENVENIRCTVAISSTDAEGDECDYECIVNERESFSKSTYEEFIFRNVKYSGAKEDLTIPANYFYRSDGAVKVSISFIFEQSDGVTSTQTFAECIYYVNDGEFIKLFGSFYDYNNYLN